MTQTAPAGWYPDPESPTQQRYWDGTAWAPNVAPMSPAEYAPHDLANPASTPQPVVDAPALQLWKTSVGFSVLGLLVGFPLLTFLSTAVAVPLMMLVDFLTGNEDLFPLLGPLLWTVVTIVYAAKLYPSYFTEKPLLRSSRTISFANLTFGGLVFGSLWNGNLTKKTKGASNVVLIVLNALFLAFLTVNIVAGLLFGAISSSTRTPGGPSTSAAPPVIEEDVAPLERTADADIYTDAETGATFVIPDTWSEQPFYVSEQGRQAKFRVPGDGGTAFYSSGDAYDYKMDDSSAERILEVMQNSMRNPTVQRASLKGVEYFVVSGADARSGSDVVSLIHIDDGHMYGFEYAKLAGDSEDENLQTFFSMVASTDYP